MAEEKLRIAAGDAGFDRRVRQLADSVSSRVRYHSIELPDHSVLPGLQSIEHLQWRLGLFDLPQDLHGKRVLDVGAWDGWFSFECERRGAQVVAVDCVELDTFLEAKRLLNSSVQYLTLDVDELSVSRLGRFDIVLFFGVLYHLRHPLAGLERVLQLSTDRVLVESFVIESENRTIPSVMEFYEGTELGGQLDNWCGPSPECLLALCRSAGFAEAELRDVTNCRASVACRRRWPEHLVSGSAGPPHLHSSVNSRSYAALFHPNKDEYICSYFRHAATRLAVGDVRIDVDGYGVPALTVTSTGAEAWQVNCLRPVGLSSGRHRVRISVKGSVFSNPVEFLMAGEDGWKREYARVELPAEPPELCSAEFQPSSDLRLSANKQGSLIVYLRTYVAVLGVPDIEIEIAGDDPVNPDTVSSLGEGVWQLNVFLRRSLPEEASIRARFAAGEWTNFLLVAYTR